MAPSPELKSGRNEMVRPLWVSVAIALGALGILLLVVGFKMPQATLTGFATSSIIEGRAKDGAPFNDISGNEIVVSFTGTLILPSGAEIAVSDGVLRFVSERGRANLSGLTAPSGSAFSLLASPDSNKFNLRIVGDELRFLVHHVEGTALKTDIEACASGACDPEGSTRPYRFTTKEGSTLHVVSDVPLRRVTLMPSLDISEFRLWTISGGGEDPLVESGLTGGHVRFLVQPKTILPFEVGEVVRIDARHMSLRTLSAGPDGFSVRFSGGVKNISGEVSGRQFSMMPRVFDWLAAQPAIKVLFGFASLLFAGYSVRKFQ